MARYFFHLNENGIMRRDEVGHDLPDLNAARREAMRTLPAIAYDEIPLDGDRQGFMVLVTDESGQPVYSATLNFTGLKLLA
jgi:hypothetical protein